MNRLNYQYCPFCAISLVERDLFHQQRLTCPACGFIHFRDPKVAVICFVTGKNRVLLIRRGVDPAKGKWALPGGYMDAGEMPEDALRRELMEEVGLQVQVQRLLDIFPLTGPGMINNGIVLAYHALLMVGDLPPLICSDDVSDAGWFTAENLPHELAFESTHTLLARWRQDWISP
jgi:ADP-ribose pyrophosphatase YjhB (NUDIX family)